MSSNTGPVSVKWILTAAILWIFRCLSSYRECTGHVVLIGQCWEGQDSFLVSVKILCHTIRSLMSNSVILRNSAQNPYQVNRNWYLSNILAIMTFRQKFGLIMFKILTQIFVSSTKTYVQDFDPYFRHWPKFAIFWSKGSKLWPTFSSLWSKFLIFLPKWSSF